MSVLRLRPYQFFVRQDRHQDLLPLAENLFNFFPFKLETRWCSIDKFQELKVLSDLNPSVETWVPDEILDILLDQEAAVIWCLCALRGRKEDRHLDIEDLEKAMKKITEVLSAQGAKERLKSIARAKPIVGWCGDLPGMLYLEDKGLAIPVHGYSLSHLGFVSEDVKLKYQYLLSKLQEDATFDYSLGKLSLENEMAKATKTVQGYVWGGLLQFVVEAIEQGFASPKEVILWLEIQDFKDESSYVRRLADLLRQQKLAVKAVLFGEIGGGSAVITLLTEHWNASIAEFSLHGIPVFANLAVGHQLAHIPLAFGWTTLSVATDLTVSLQYDMNKTLEILNNKRKSFLYN